MHKRAIPLLHALLLTAATLAAAEPLEPHVQPASSEARRQIANFRIPSGMKVELFAAEPDVANPVALCFDEQGRIYVAESFRIRHGNEDNRWHTYWIDDDMAARTVDDRIAFVKKHEGAKADEWARQTDRIRLLEDRTGSGRADHSTVFADGFNHLADGIGAGVLANHGDIYYTDIPHLWKLRDENADGRADRRDSLHYGYGVHFTYVGHDMHGLIIGPDGKLYFSIGDRGLNVDLPDRHLVNIESGSILRCNLDGSDLEIFATGFRNPQELAFDDYGNLFTCDNNSDLGDQARWTYVVEGMDAGWRFYYQYLPDRGPFNRERLWQPHFDGQAAYIVPPIANLSDGPSGLCYDPGVGLNEKYRGCFFLADFRGTPGASGIRAIRVKPKGAGFELVGNEKFWWSILATDVAFGPDCQLYASDWAEGWDGSGKGRIYRLFDPATVDGPAAQEVKKLLASDWSKPSIADLLKLLEHAHRRVRQEAQFELVRRAAIKELADVALNGKQQLARIHALWALGQFGIKRTNRAIFGRGMMDDSELVPELAKLFGDPDSEIRAQAIRIIGSEPTLNVGDQVLAAIEDNSPRVRFFAMMALSKRTGRGTVTPLLEVIAKMLAENNDEDPFVRHACILALANLAKPWELVEFARKQPPAMRTAVVVALRRMQHPAVAAFLQDDNPFVLLEAARAINDVPIPAVTSDLADLLDQPFFNYRRIVSNVLSRDQAARRPPNRILALEIADAVFRRVLNASFRLGGAKRAEAIARFATTNDREPDNLRIAALDMLGDWATPSPHDRVLNALRPIEPRNVAEAANALNAFPTLTRVLSPGESNAFQKKAIQVCGKLQVPGALQVSAKVLGTLNGKPWPADIRVESLRALEELNDPYMAQIAVELLADPEPSVRAEARRLLVKLKPEQALPELKKAIENGQTVERQQALTTIIDSRLPGADELLDTAMEQLLTGKMPPELQLDLLEAVQSRDSAKLKAQLARYQESLPKDDPLAEYRVALAGGDAERGERIFRESNELSCRRCHKVGHGAGGVGPDLTSIAKDLRTRIDEPYGSERLEQRIREYLLESIVLPNKTIAKGFETVIVITKDGLQRSGVKQSEDDRELRLMTPEGQLVVVAKDNIEERTSGPSAMPADLVKHMTKRQLRDLVEFLANLKGQLAEDQ
jgi:quinoprotein glucose dehydrogenase